MFQVPDTLDLMNLSQVPDTGFSCEGQVEGGKYADPGAKCQVGNTPVIAGTCATSLQF